MHRCNASDLYKHINMFQTSYNCKKKRHYLRNTFPSAAFEQMGNGKWDKKF